MAQLQKNVIYIVTALHIHPARAEFGVLVQTAWCTQLGVCAELSKHRVSLGLLCEVRLCTGGSEQGAGRAGEPTEPSVPARRTVCAAMSVPSARKLCRGLVILPP